MGDPNPHVPLEKRDFGRYELLIEMGHGGMATLYLARLRGPESFEKLLAIKRIHDHLSREKEFVGMFLDEAHIAAKVQHPNVATIFDMGKIEGAYFMAMEYIHGQDLNDVIRTGIRNSGMFHWYHAARIVADAAAGLHAAHELRAKDGTPLGVVHRDVSHQNILVSYDGHVKVVDFGIAYAAEKIVNTKSGTLKGKTSYMSPEQASGTTVDRRSDIFSLGVVLFEAVCLRRLFKESTEAATLLKVRAAAVPSARHINPAIPADLERILYKALARKPEDRYETAEQFAEELESLLIDCGERTPRSKVAALMDQLFYDRRRIRDEQIKDALEAAPEKPVRAVGVKVGVSSSTPSMPTIGAVDLQGPRRSWLPYALGGAGLLIAIILAIIALSGGEKKAPKKPPPPTAMAPAMEMPAPTTTTPPPPAAEMTAPPGRVSLRVRVLPVKPGVKFRFRGTDIEGPVLSLKVKRSSQPEKVRITAPGHEPNTVVVIPNGDTDIKVALVALQQKPTARRTIRRTVRRRSAPRRRPRSSGLRRLPD